MEQVALVYQEKWNDIEVYSTDDIYLFSYGGVGSVLKDDKLSIVIHDQLYQSQVKDIFLDWEYGHYVLNHVNKESNLAWLGDLGYDMDCDKFLKKMEYSNIRIILMILFQEEAKWRSIPNLALLFFKIPGCIFDTLVRILHVLISE